MSKHFVVMKVLLRMYVDYTIWCLEYQLDKTLIVMRDKQNVNLFCPTGLMESMSWSSVSGSASKVSTVYVLLSILNLCTVYVFVIPYLHIKYDTLNQT